MKNIYLKVNSQMRTPGLNGCKTQQHGVVLKHNQLMLVLFELKIQYLKVI